MTEQVTATNSVITAGRYEFANRAEARATYFVIAWFAITESAAVGIFPLLSALNEAHTHDPAYFGQFFEHGFQHFKDEQRHANLWCRALLDFTQTYPEVVKEMKLPQRYLKIMLGSIGKQHSVLQFGTDCLAFELVMQALYDVVAPRLPYPPLQPIFQVITRDEVNHAAFDHGYIENLTVNFSKIKRFRLGFRFWRNTLGVLLTVGPLLTQINAWRPLPRRDFYTRLIFYQRQTVLPGSGKAAKF